MTQYQEQRARMRATEDLNDLTINYDDGTGKPLEDHGVFVKDASVRVFFKDIEAYLVALIDAHANEYGESAWIVGCVAWLTSERILAALARVQCSIIVQKEDLWRPDIGQKRTGYKARLRGLYNQLGSRGLLERPCFPGVSNDLSVRCDPSIAPIRCVGNLNSARVPSSPRSHHKFIVFGCFGPPASDQGTWPTTGSRSVWTGSFNFTKNASSSFENAVLIHHPGVARAYTLEWSQILGLSEPLDYSAEWVEPEYRIGT